MKTAFFFLFITVVLWGQERLVTPDDPYFKYQISFDNPGGTLTIPQLSFRLSPTETYTTQRGLDHNMRRAWSLTTGSKNIVVAILDDGFFYQHEDVKDNIWRNPGETGVDANGLRKETNGVDDDSNGYVDDVVGWDFVFRDPDPDPYIFDGMDTTRIQPHWHAIAAMGIIGAKGNNAIGIAGINWDISMMLLKKGAQGRKMGDQDPEEVGRAVRAIRYAVDNGARVINWSGYTEDQRPASIAALKAAFEYADRHGVLIVIGAGNALKNLNDPANCIYPPQCFEMDNLLSVAQLAFEGDLFRFKGSEGSYVSGSNFGPRYVHIAAIGNNFTTLMSWHSLSVYRLASGTSNAAPVVTGAAALMLSVHPELKAHELK
ncbi:MAG: S8 family serine peptidase, partial [Bryobacteraceae bacterium]|nr:S8 family serine peptidase [Bryobacteraceae bacterium]